MINLMCPSRSADPDQFPDVCPGSFARIGRKEGEEGLGDALGMWCHPKSDGDFLSHRGTRSHHPFIDGFSMK